MKKLVSLIIICLVFLTGCSHQWYGSGYVLEKDHTPSYRYQQYCGRNCYTTATKPECYRLLIQADDGTQQDGCVIDKKVWETAAVGRYITIKKGEN